MYYKINSISPGYSYILFKNLFRELRSLHINGLENIRDIQLLCLLLEDILPEIKIVGIDYMDTSSLQKSTLNEDRLL